MWDASSIDLYCLPSLRVYPGCGPTPTGVHLRDRRRSRDSMGVPTPQCLKTQPCKLYTLYILYTLPQRKRSGMAPRYVARVQLGSGGAIVLPGTPSHQVLLLTVCHVSKPRAGRRPATVLLLRRTLTAVPQRRYFYVMVRSLCRRQFVLLSRRRLPPEVPK